MTSGMQCLGWSAKKKPIYNFQKKTFEGTQILFGWDGNTEVGRIFHPLAVSVKKKKKKRFNQIHGMLTS